MAGSLDDRPLDACGCQLVVPGDICGARYVSAVTAVWFGAHAFAAPDRRPTVPERPAAALSTAP